MKVADIIREWKFKTEFAGHQPSKDFLDCLRGYTNSYVNTGVNDNSLAGHCDAVFQAEMQPLRESDTVFRGVELDSLAQMGAGADFLNRRTISFGRYISVTWDNEIAENFLRRDFGKKVLVMFEIQTKAGAPAIVLKDYVDTSDDFAKWEDARDKVMGYNSFDNDEDDEEFNKACEIFAEDEAFEDFATETILNKDAVFQVLAVDDLANHSIVTWNPDAAYYVKLRQVK